MKRWGSALLVVVALVVVGACSPDDDRADVQQVDEVHTPAPVMPMDTMMTDDTTMLRDTTVLRDTVPPQAQP